VLIRLLRAHLGPYRRAIGLVVLFQFLQTLATLYLPTLNADIIDKGVVKGDTDFIWRTGGMMLVVCFIQVIAAVTATYFGARASMSASKGRAGCSPVRCFPHATSASA